MNEDLPAPDWVGAVACADSAGAGLHDEQLPLVQVGVERTHGGAGRNAADLHVERMSAAPRAAIANSAERKRDVLAPRVKPAGGRMLFLPRNRRDVGLVHSEFSKG